MHAPKPTPSAAVEMPLLAKRGPHRILVVEDDPRNLRLMGALLRAEGFEILTAADGEAAVASVRENLPDLVLMDIQLPKLNGLEATHLLKQDPDTRHIPVIAVTALAMRGDRERILASGCDGYVSKPIRFPEVLGTIQACLHPDNSQGPE